MASVKRTSTEREADLVLIERWYLRDQLTQTEIAERLSNDRHYTVTQQLVSYDLKELQKRWKLSTTLDMDELKGRELRRIDELELTYWQAWERSQSDAETAVQKQTPRGREASVTKKGQVGDPRFLAGVQWCIEQRCKILGLLSPQVVEWRVEAVRDIKAGKLDYSTVLDAFGDETLARQLFAEAGIPVQ